MKRHHAPIALALALLLTGAASAQRRSTTLRPPPEEARLSLRAHFGVERAKRWLTSNDPVLRRRAIERLGASGKSRAIELLTQALEPEGVAKSPEERLLVVRALSASVADERVRVALTRAMGGGQAGDAPLDDWVRTTAALALARSRSPAALDALSKALRKPGRVSETARIAVSAYPPSRVSALLAARGAPTEALVSLLGELGDRNAKGLLLTAAQRGAPELRALAARSLYTLDAPAATALAEAWLRSERHPALRVAATDVLVRANHATAERAFDELLRAPTERDDAIAIALESPSPALVGPLTRALGDAPAGERELLYGAIGRAGGAAAFTFLERALRDPNDAWAAAYALASNPSDAATKVLERALAHDATRREATRAGAIRRFLRGESLDGLTDSAERLLGSKSAADRAAGAFALASDDPERAVTLLASKDEMVARAVLGAALSARTALAAADQLVRATDATSIAALSLCLTHAQAADRVPTGLLSSLVEQKGAAAHLAAMALAARDDEDLRPGLRELFASSDATLRAHVALGLARSEDPSVGGMLSRGYEFEPNAEVRRAIVRALIARKDGGGARVLELAAALDPDREARELARFAVAGVAPKAPAPTAFWARLTDAGGRPPDPDVLALLVTESSLSLPLAPSPDGSVIVLGLDPGPVRVTLALPAPGVNAPPRTDR
jgi:hypothetical protein